jgi:DNA invertase Pin-like site-specific DNA recombinase
MTFGYIRVSTQKQNLEIQIEALKKYNIDKLFEEKASGRKTDREVLKELLDQLRPDDTLVIYDLSRLGRTTHQVMQLIDHFQKNNIGFISIKENFDITTPMGKAMISIIASFNQMQVEIQNEKIKDGLKNAKQKGIKLGRKPISLEKVRIINALSNQGFTNKEIASKLGLSIRTIINYKNNSQPY